MKKNFGFSESKYKKPEVTEQSQDIAKLLTKLIEISKKLDTLKYKIKDTEDFLVDEGGEIMSYYKFKRFVKEMIESQENKLSELTVNFNKFFSENKELIKGYLSYKMKIKISEAEEAVEMVKHFKGGLNKFLATKKELENLQSEINKELLIASNLESSKSLEEFGNQMNVLNERISQIIEIYELAIEKTKILVSMWKKALQEFDIDGSYRQGFLEERWEIPKIIKY